MTAARPVAPGGQQPDFSRWLSGSMHNVSALVPSMCDHGAAMVVVDPEDVPPQRARIAGTIADGRVAIRPPIGSSWVRSKYMTGNMTCVIEQGQPRPDDLAAAAMIRPSPALCVKPVRVWIAEPYDPAAHGPIQE